MMRQQRTWVGAGLIACLGILAGWWWAAALSPARAQTSVLDGPSVVQMGNFRVKLLLGWKRGDLAQERQHNCFIYEYAPDARAAAAPWRVLLPGRGQACADDKARLDWMAQQREQLRQANPKLSVAARSVAGVPSEIWSWEQQQQRRFVLVIYNRDEAFLLTVLAPEQAKVEQLAPEAGQFIDAMELIGRPHPDRKAPPEPAATAKPQPATPILDAVKTLPPQVTTPSKPWPTVDPAKAIESGLAKLPETAGKPADWGKVLATPEAGVSKPGDASAPGSAAVGSTTGGATGGTPPAGRSAAELAKVRTQMQARYQAIAQLAQVPPANVPDFLDINHLTPLQYAGAVSAAMEAMRLVYGEMNEQDEAKFNAKWLPLFDHPCAEVIDYFNKLNPLLGKFLATREALNQALEVFDAAQLDAMTAAAFADASIIEEAMESAMVGKGVIQSLGARLEQTSAELATLGDPPNVGDLKRRARKRHEDAFKEFAREKPLLSIIPADLAASPGLPYEFAVQVGKVPADAKLECMWTFSDGFSKRTAVEEKITHKFYGDPKNPQQSVQVQLIDSRARKVIATALGNITLAFAQGKWVLTGRQVKSDPGKQGARFKGGRHNAATGQWEPIREVDENIFDNALALADLSARCDFANLTKTYAISFRQSWTLPPLKVEQTQPIAVTLSVEHASSTHPFKYCDAHIQAYLDFYPYGPDVRSSQMTQPGERLTAHGPTEDNRQPADLSAKKTVTFTAPRVYVRGPKGEPIKPEGQYLILTVTGGANMGHLTGGGPKFTLTYRYDWDPTGNSLKPLGSAGSGELAGGASGKNSQDDPSADPQRQARIKQEQIDFHKTNIEYFKTNIDSLQARLARSPDPGTYQALQRDLLYNQDAMQRELDQIQTLQTGEFVHTRTAADALNMAIMLRQGQEQAAKWSAIHNILERAPRLINSAPPEDRDRLREFFYRQMDSKTIADGDLEKMRRVTASIGNQVIGQYEAQAAKAQQDLISAEQRLAYAENVKSVADTSLMILSFGGGTGVYMGYMGATGYVEGGAEEAFKRTATGYSVLVHIANQTIEGYQKGVLDHLEQYAQNPGKIQLDETSAGLSGAAWSGGEAAAMAAIMHLGMKSLTSQLNVRQPAGKSPGQKWPTVQEQLAQAQFQSRQANGRVMVRLFEQRSAALAAAGKANASKAEILKLRQSAEEAYKLIKTDYFAKMALNAQGRAGDSKLIHYYQSHDRASMSQLKAAVEQNMLAQGFSPQQYKTFSNSASKGKVGMDIDLGVVEPPRYISQGGKNVPNPEHLQWQQNLTRKMPDGSVVRVKPHQLQEAGQHSLEKAFEQVYGRKPGEAMVNFTTSYHPEAYRDSAWLGKKGLKTADIHHVDPSWTQQAADVTGFKVNNLPKEHPSLGKYATLQEQCRGMVKDFDTKLSPLLKRSNNKEAVNHMGDIYEVMRRFSLNEISPIEADRKLRILTGGEGIKGVQDRFSIMLQGLARSP